MAIDFDKVGQGVLTSVGSSLLSAGIGAISGRSSAHYERKNTRANMDYQHAINIRDAKNKYLYELEALRKAGVNTAMLGGEFSQAGVNPTSASGSAPDMRGPDVDFAGGIAKLAQTEQAESATELNKSTSQAQTAKARLDNAEAERLEMTQGVFLRQSFSSLYQTAAQTEFIRSQKDYTDQQKENASFDLYRGRLALDDTLRNLRLTGDELDARIREIGTNISIRQQELPYNLKLLRAKTYEAYQSGNLSKEQCIVAQKMVDVLGEQYEGLRLNNQFTRETMDSKIALVNQSNYLGINKALLEDKKLRPFFEHPEEYAQMNEDEFRKAVNDAIYGAKESQYNRDAVWLMTTMKQLGVATQAIGNLYSVNVGYGNFTSTNFSHNMTPPVGKSPIIQPQQGGSFNLYEAQQLINPYNGR